MIQYDILDLTKIIGATPTMPLDAPNHYMLVIPTNGFVKPSTQSLVMGCGFAKQMADLIPGLDKELGQKVTMWGNTVQTTTSYGWTIFTLPVKPGIAVYDGTNCVQHMRHRFKVGDYITGWGCRADLGLLRASLKQLKTHILEYQTRNHTGVTISTEVYMPRPGCGAGELKWADVKSVLEDEFDQWMALHSDISVHVCALRSDEFTI